MVLGFRSRRLLIFTGIVFLLVICSEFLSKSNLKYSLITWRAELKLQGHEKQGKVLIDKLVDNTGSMQDIEDLLSGNVNRISGLFIYEDGLLDSWTESSFSLPDTYDDKLFSRKVVFLQNRWLRVRSVSDSNKVYIDLTSFYRDYNIENDYIRSGFEERLRLPPNAELCFLESEGYPVSNLEGEYLFSITYDKTGNFVTGLTVIPVVLWIVLSVLLFLLVEELIIWLRKGERKMLAFFTGIQAAVLFYLGFLLFDWPEVISRLEVFDSFRFTLGTLIPSPGHLLIASLLFVYICYIFFRHFPMKKCSMKAEDRSVLKLSIAILISSGIFFMFSQLLEFLITGSNINFDLYKILDLDYFSVVALGSAGLVLAGMCLYLVKLAKICRDIDIRYFVVVSLPGGLAVFLFNYFFGVFALINALVFLLFLIVVWIFRSEKSKSINIASLYAIIAGVYMAYTIPKLVWQKESSLLEVLAINYSNENDAYAEALLIDAVSEMKNDTILSETLGKRYFEENELNTLYSYLDSIWFNGYWENYEIIYTICMDDSPLNFEDETAMAESCFEFFRNRSDKYGIPLTDTNIVFIDNNSGRAYYQASLFFDSGNGRKSALFIDLVNLVKYIQPGYPELLLDKSIYKQTKIGDYSIAKYINDSLVMIKGDHPFDPAITRDKEGELVYSTANDDDYDYYIYNNSAEVCIIIARPVVKFVSMLINFTYLFVFLFLMLILCIMLVRPPSNFMLSRLNFTKKLQMTFVAILMGSTIAVGSVVLILSARQYRTKHYENIEEKLGSVFIELDHKLSGEDQLSADWRAPGYANLDALLIKFSNVFKTDINLYSIDGTLLASSRKEVFTKELTSTRMDPAAFKSLAVRGEAQFIHNERIGKLEYLSAYTPFVNYRNEVQAYLNLPYFNMQSRISEEISNLIVAIVNFSVLLLVLSMSIAVFISVRITNPLRMLQEGLASVKLGQKSKALEYRGHDEISELVSQYNLMLEKLEESAVRLARSEREDAWREMAKQIAHEIKNPLTPMKLNVQQLYKTWKDKPDDFDKILKTFSENQIENIDSLSSIASEFTSFARMPQASPRETDLVSHIQSASELFSNINNIDLKIDCNKLKKLIIFADSEQTSRMLTNLMRNAVQAIPGGKKGEIDISLEVADDKALIKIRDNGVGIPDDLRNKLFSPNFTTKSSGMGLGLAIVLRIVETANGRIWFDSEKGKGSCFYVEYPLISYSYS